MYNISNKLRDDCFAPAFTVNFGKSERTTTVGFSGHDFLLVS